MTSDVLNFDSLIITYKYSYFFLHHQKTIVLTDYDYENEKTE